MDSASTTNWGTTTRGITAGDAMMILFGNRKIGPSAVVNCRLARLALLGFLSLVSCTETPEPTSPPVEPISADLPMPDGRLVPNFTFAGVPGGIPAYPQVVRLIDFGARPGSCVAEALEAASAAAEARGGGAILIAPGEYFLDRPVHLTQSGIVIRGSGMDATTLTFRWEPPRNRVVFLGTREGETIPPLRTLIIAAWNDSRDNHMVRCIKRLALEINGEVVAEQRATQSNEGPWFMLSPDNRQTAKLLRPGPNTLRASVDYFDGRKDEKKIEVIVREGAAREFTARDAAIHFSPPNSAQTFYEPMVAEIRRGDLRIKVRDVGDLRAGQPVMLKGSGGAWTAWPWHLVAAVEGDTVVLASPVRLDMVLENMRRMPAIMGSGLEDLTLRQTSVHWTSLLAFENDVTCFARRVRLAGAGRFPFTGGRKHFEMRDCVVDGAQFHFGIGGGTAYLGFSGCFDGLITGTRARNLRHAPNIQRGSMGCVIRDSVFEGSDAQYHSSPNWENLIENNTICSVGGSSSFGSYGSGLYICARPETSFGGSGNIFYRNDVTSRNAFDPRWPAAAIKWEGGSGENQWIVGNRFNRIEGAGPLIAFSAFATRVRIEENVFVDGSQGQALVDGNSAEAEFVGNKFVVPPDHSSVRPRSFERGERNLFLEKKPENAGASAFPPSLFTYQKSLIDGLTPSPVLPVQTARQTVIVPVPES